MEIKRSIILYMLTAAKKVWQPLMFLLIFFLISWSQPLMSNVNDLSYADSVINLKTPNKILLQNLIMEKINKLRAKSKLANLKLDDTLYMSSNYHLINMLNKKFFDHDYVKDPKYPNLKQRVEIFSKRYLCLSENLLETFPFRFSGKSISYLTKKRKNAFEYLDPITHKPMQVLSYNQFAQEIVNSWANSDVHYKNMMNPQYIYIGIAINFPKYFELETLGVTTIVANFGGCKQ